MTAWEKLVDIVCPERIAQYLNDISGPEEPAFSMAYIQKLEEKLCDYDCAKCWANFLNEESE